MSSKMNARQWLPATVKDEISWFICQEMKWHDELMFACFLDGMPLALMPSPTWATSAIFRWQVRLLRTYCVGFLGQTDAGERERIGEVFSYVGCLVALCDIFLHSGEANRFLDLLSQINTLFTQVERMTVLHKDIERVSDTQPIPSLLDGQIQTLRQEAELRSNDAIEYESLQERIAAKVRRAENARSILRNRQRLAAHRLCLTEVFQALRSTLESSHINFALDDVSAAQNELQSVSETAASVYRHSRAVESAVAEVIQLQLRRG